MDLSKFAFLLIVSGILLIMGYVGFQIMVSPMPLVLRVGMLLVIGGIILIVFKQINDRRFEKNEEDEYKDL